MAQSASAIQVGTRVRITAPDVHSGWIVGRLVSADSAALVLDPKYRRWGSPLILEPASVTRVQVSQGRIGTMRREGAAAGGLILAAVALYGAWRLDYTEGTYSGYLLVPLGAVGGAGLGAVLGGFAPREGWEPAPTPVRTVLDEPGGRTLSVALSLGSRPRASFPEEPR